ncbi:MAG: hypothetical protein ACM3YO_03595 [Bacteroidota bacterium]
MGNVTNREIGSRIESRVRSASTPLAPAATPAKAPTGTLRNRGTQPLDPSATVAGQRMQAYKDPQEAAARAALDQLRTQFPNLSQEQWVSYLSTPPQVKVEQKAATAAQTTVNAASPTEKAAAEQVSQSFQTKNERKYTTEEVLIYKELKKALPASAQADLKKLLLDGKLLEQDAKNSGTLLHYLHGLSKLDFSGAPVFEGAKKESVLQQITHDLAHPEAIEHRLDTTCLGAAAQYDMAKSRPAEYARVVSEMYTSAQPNPMLSTLGIDTNSPFLRGIFKQMEKRADEGKFSEGFMASLYDFVQKKFPNMSDNARKFMSNVLEAGKAFYVDKDPIKAYNMIIGNRKQNLDGIRDEVSKMVNTLATDTSLVFQVASGQEGDQVGSYAKNGLMGNQGYYTGPGALDAIRKTLAGGHEPYAILKGEDSGHMMVIKNIQDGKITFHDPEGGEETIDEKDFEKKFLAVFLPEGNQGNLAHLREDDKTPIWGRGSARTLSTMR